MQEGCAPERSAIGKCGGPLGRIEDKLDTAVFDGVNDVRTSLGHLVDFHGVNACGREVSLGS